MCRLDKGEYSFAGVHHKIRKHYLGDEAIHGLLYNAVFDISDYKETDEHATVTLSYTYNNNEEGFPYAYEMMVEYMLGKNNQLTVTTKVKILAIEIFHFPTVGIPILLLEKRLTTLVFSSMPTRWLNSMNVYCRRACCCTIINLLKARLSAKPFRQLFCIKRF